MIRRLLPVAAVVLCLAGPVGAMTLPAENRPWIRLDADGFVLFTNAEAETARRVGRDLQGLRRAMASITRLELRSPVPTTIFVFADDHSMTAYKHRYQGEPVSMSGAFYTQLYGDYIVMNGERRREATRTVFHEYMHSVLRNNLPGLPLWLDEGLAEVFSSFEVVDGRGQIGRPFQRHLRELAKGEPLSLEELLRVDVDSPHYNVFEHQGELYARSWELVHYLLLGNGDRRRQMLDFLALGFAGAEQDKAFERTFGGIGYEVLEKELMAYRREGLERREVKTVGGSAADTFRVTPVPYTQILVHLGDLLVAQGDRRQAALFHFEEALRRDPAHGGAVAGLGLVAQKKRDYPKARALFRRAVALAPRDARLHYHYGTSLLVLGRGASRKKLDEARLHLRRSVELMPDFAPAWARLVALDRLKEKDAETRPPDPAVALQLLLLYGRTGDREEARSLYIDFFVDHPDESIRGAAEGILRRMDWLAAEGKSEPIDIVR